MSAKNTKIVLVLGALVLFVLLYILPKSESAHSADDGHNHEATSAAKTPVDANLEVYVNMAIKNLDPTKKATFDKLVSESKNDSLVHFWDRMKRPDIASYYLEKESKKANTNDLWNKAGNRYYYAIQFIKDETEVPVLYQRAIFCFKKAIELKPGDTDSKIMLASCFVEGTPNPMDGITALKEIEKTDSTNLKLQLTFAFFSVRSGQFDKAIYRFNKVLRIDSTYIEAYLHLADAYEKLNEKEKTITMLENYALRSNDPTAKIEIRRYIEQLKTSN